MDLNISKINQQMQHISEKLNQVAREIYYAKSLIDSNHPAQANLNLALQCLGISSPKEVGLSNSVLEKK